MNTNKELDLKIAQKIMGDNVSDSLSAKSYSKEFSLAYQVIHQMKTKFNSYAMIRTPINEDGTMDYIVQFIQGKNIFESKARELPEAVCNAALSVVDKSPKKQLDKNNNIKNLKGYVHPVEVNNDETNIKDILREFLENSHLTIKSNEQDMLTFKQLVNNYFNENIDNDKINFDQIIDELALQFLEEIKNKGYMLVKENSDE